MNAQEQVASIRQLVERFANDIRVSVMAEVLACDPDTLSVTVKPLYLERIPAEKEREMVYEEMQTIESVPIADVCGIRFLPPIGSHGLLVFNDVDLDVYKTTRERAEPSSARNHDYNDAIFIPIEITQSDRPDPYMTLDGGLITVHKDTVFEKSVDCQEDVHVAGNQITDGDVQAGTNVVSLTNLATQYASHIHVETGAVTVVTTMLAYQGTATFVPYEGEQKAGGTGGGV